MHMYYISAAGDSGKACVSSGGILQGIPGSLHTEDHQWDFHGAHRN